MLQIGMNSRILKTIYGVFFPITVFLLLLGVASINNRPNILGSAIADFIVRFMLTFWFCGLYRRLSRFSSFSFFPNKKWAKSDVGGTEKYFYLSLSLLFSIGCSVITWWIIRWFFSYFSGFAFIISTLNGFVVFLPLAIQYWVLKL